MSQKILPKELTSYDFLKTLAVILMIIDHAGYYFFPDDAVFRILGRYCVPIWFFLIGYAQSRDFRVDWSVGCLILVAASLVTQGYLLPLNILGSMLAVRLVLDKVALIAFKDMESMIYTVFVGTLIYFPTSMLFEYGSLGILLALIGYMVRHNKEIKFPFEQKTVFFVCIAAVVIFFQFTIAEMDLIGKAAIAVGMGAVMIALIFFKPKKFPALTKKMPYIGVVFFQLAGRRTMEIYVLHLLLFKALATYMGIEGFGWQEWTVFYHGTIDIDQTLLSETGGS